LIWRNSAACDEIQNMSLISLRALSLTLGKPLFQNLDFTLNPRDRVGLVAQNGAGKTSLMRVLLGELDATSGEVTRARGLRVASVPQDVPERLLGLDMRQAVLDGLPPSRHDTDMWMADVALDAFAAPYDMRERQVKALSGGWQRLMLIARAIVDEPDLLLLDEPTNHLDLGKIRLLEDWLTGEGRNRALIAASHDRAFLARVTTRTLFLRPGASREFPLPYAAARLALDGDDKAVAVQNERDLREADKLRKQAAKLTNIGINSGSDLLTVKAKQLKDRASRIEGAVRDMHKERSGEIRLGNSGTHARLMLALENLVVTTPTGDSLFKIEKLHLFQADRLVLLGPNGAGKTQLVKLIAGAIGATEGIAGVRVAGSLRLGYSDQELSQLPQAKSPSEFISTAFDLPDQRVTSLLAAIGLPVEAQTRPIARMSPGQKARLALLGLRLTEPNFYLLDEPTNHVDIVGRETLEAEILAHGATAVVVSHDRSFIRAVGSRFFEIRGRKLVEVDSPEAFFASAVA
jgi:ATPase subunit of ABC transporter with duplicated ATPase domains